MKDYLYRVARLLDGIKEEDPAELKVGAINLAIDVLKWGAAQDFGLSVATSAQKEYMTEAMNDDDSEG